LSSFKILFEAISQPKKKLLDPKNQTLDRFSNATNKGKAKVENFR